jgi:hypothetical protein
MPLETFDPNIHHKEDEPETNALDEVLNLKSQISTYESSIASTAVPDLKQFSLLGESKSMKEQMLNDVFILKNIAILGQITALYAPPNAGKTLITLWLLIEAIDDGRIIADDVFYINADDNYKGLVTKAELAEKHGFHMLSPGHKGFSAENIVSHLGNWTSQEQAKGKILVLDTAKKFMDLMDKRNCSNFMATAREFSVKGGSLILLAHVNKHRDSSGNLIHAGTTDLTEDADCTFIVDVVEQGSKRTSIFENKKHRGDVADKICFSYTSERKINYFNLLDSVVRENDDSIQDVVDAHAKAEQLEKDRECIGCIIEVLSKGSKTKTEIVSKVLVETGISRRSIINVINRYSGKNEKWTRKIGVKNASIYTLNRVKNHKFFDSHPPTEKSEN